MRKIFCLAILACVLPICSCSGMKEPSYDFLHGEYHFFGTCEYDGIEYGGIFYISAGNDFCQREKRITLASPDRMNSVEIYSVGGNTTVTRGGITIEMGDNDAGLWRIFELFNIGKGTAVKEKEDGIKVFADDATYVIKIENGKPKSISRTRGTEQISIRIGELYE